MSTATHKNDNQPSKSAKSTSAASKNESNNEERGEAYLRQSPMMAHLLDALQEGTDIGHYGRLTFAMVARHFLDDAETVALLSKQSDSSEEDARRLLVQVEGRDYNPPKRERILAWQQEQDFPICPDASDPSSCNIYSDLRFPDSVYENIEEFYEEKAEAQQS